MVEVVTRWPRHQVSFRKWVVETECRDGWKFVTRYILASTYAKWLGISFMKTSTTYEVILSTFQQFFISNKLLMFANAVRSCASLNKFIASKNILLPKRKFSIISIHTSFPASIYRFQPQRSSGLFGYKQDGDIEDGLKVSANGLIYPRVSHDVPCRYHLSFVCTRILTSSFSLQRRSFHA